MNDKKKLAKWFFASGSIGILGIVFSAWAANLNCDVCGMSIPDNARNHIVLKSDAKDGKVFHVCSPTCAHKARKNDVKLTKAEITDFNHPEKMLAGEKAFFLMQSKKIKADMGEKAMAPYAAGFSTKEEAEAAKSKYGDGVVVEGAENALK